MNYDNWKLREPPEEPVPHPLSCIDKIGNYAEFFHKRIVDGKTVKHYVVGMIADADNESVTLNAFGRKTKYFLDDLIPITMDENDE